MESISLKFVYKLENGNTRLVTIKDVSPAVTEAQIDTLGDILIEKRCQYKGSPFVTLSKKTKVVTTEEDF